MSFFLNKNVTSSISLVFCHQSAYKRTHTQAHAQISAQRKKNDIGTNRETNDMRKRVQLQLYEKKSERKRAS